MRSFSWFALPLALLAACTDSQGGKDDTGTGDDTGAADTDTDTDTLEDAVLHCGTIEADETWSAADTHRVTCDVKVLKGTLTIEAGATVYVADGKGIEAGDGEVEAGLVLDGTADAPIVLRPVLDAGEDTRWSGLSFKPNATTARVSHVEIVDGGDDRTGGVYVEGTELAVDGLSITGAELCGLKLAEGGRLAEGARGIVVTESGGAGVCAGVAQVHTLPSEGSTYTGNLYDQVNVSGSDLSETVTWRDLGVPYAILDSVDIENTADAPAILTIASGVEVRMGDRTELTFSPGGGASALIADGVTFTALGASLPGSWRGITFEHGTSAATSLTGTRIEYAGGDAQIAALVIADSLVYLRDLTIDGSATTALRIEGSSQLAEGSGGLVLTGSAQPLSMVPNAIGTLPLDSDLSGNEDDVILLSGEGDVYVDATWSALAWDYRVDTNISVDGSAEYPVHITIDPGATFRFANDRRLVVGGNGASALYAVGTASAPIRFIPYDAYVDGAWGGIGIYGGSLGEETVLENFEIGWAGGERMGAGLVIAKTSPIIASGYVHDSPEWGVSIECSDTIPTDMTYDGTNVIGDEVFDPSC